MILKNASNFVNDYCNNNDNLFIRGNKKVKKKNSKK